MTTRPFRAVIGASVGVELFVPEPLSSQALAVFSHVEGAQDTELIVPSLFFAECANVFWKWVHRTRYSKKDAEEHLRNLTQLGLSVAPTYVLISDALQIALRYDVTACDACYVARAARTQAPLTADRKLLERIKQTAHEVLWLGDIEG